MFALFAPAQTPNAVVNRLNEVVVGAVGRADLREKFLATGVEPATSSPEKLAAILKSEVATLTRLANEAGLRTR